MAQDQEKLDRVAYYLQQGLSRTEIAKKMGVSYTTIVNWSKQYNLEDRKIDIRARDDYSWQIIFHCRDLALHNENTSIEDISKKYCIPESIIRIWVDGYLEGDDFGTTKEILNLADELAEMRDPMETVQREVKMRDLEVKVAIYEAAESYLKGLSISEATAMQKTALVDAIFPRFSKTLLFEKLEISSSTYYACKNRDENRDKYAEIRPLIRQIFDEVDGTRGHRYIRQKLRELKDPVRISAKTVRKLMKEEGLRTIYYKKAKHYNSFSGDKIESPKNLVKRDFHAEKPNQLWLTDITEMRIRAGKIYLSPLLDCFDGALVSWRIEKRPTGSLVNEMLQEGISKLEPNEKPIIHTDHGVHYQWPKWVKICEENGLTRSMSRKGCSPDNSAMEGFFGRLKNEFFFHRNWQKISLDKFIERLNEYLLYYNEQRPKEKLNWMSPAQYRKSLGYAL